MTNAVATNAAVPSKAAASAALGPAVRTRRLKNQYLDLRQTVDFAMIYRVTIYGQPSISLVARDDEARTVRRSKAGRSTTGLIEAVWHLMVHIKL